ncbi:P-loop containing nucleoside triphosphate hydrolase protein [Punctularia strigosozonata HHB-11173 SS5]|uniref:P-loop containing nucleoside triphosphate hydrolase protein n=1 Tax=Punctularia strigosozonata (strain HHB-11173) TaxID=741275 RepID=UPI000441847C|nr:P-loop containing nucleoside triphosphate hydrolase protein [Punctularia strigosozonata HHB-11173 SS5]EIN11363.1 P-loop containing nucleoside triphosphate hydrolase protein [Punctularia strigosozonata HHB-11173 SS5]
MDTPRRTRSTRRSTRNTVLGKRSLPRDESPSSAVCDAAPLTPQPTPDAKRAKTSPTVVISDGHNNKENIPPLRGLQATPASPSLSRTRSLRRTVSTTVVTPSRRPAVRRFSTFGTSEFAALSIATPPPTPSTSTHTLESRARALLRVGTHNAGIVGREAEQAVVFHFADSFLEGDVATETDPVSTLYISGTPGTGKTALVDAVLHDIAKTRVLHLLKINCMALKTIDDLWSRLAEELRSVVGVRGRKPKACQDAVASALSSSQCKCIVVLDELDHISSPQALASLFSLANTQNDKLRLIGIANTHTLTSASSNAREYSGLGVQTLHFAPYSSDDLLSILKRRLSPILEAPDSEQQAKKFLPPSTLMLLSKKVAAQTGDVRAVFEVLRGAIDLAAASYPPHSSSPKTADVSPNKAPTVTPSHVLDALKAYAPASNLRNGPTPSTASELVTKVRNLGLQARLALLSFALAIKRLEAGLSISDVPSSPKKPRSPTKRSSPSFTFSCPSPVSRDCVESSSLYGYYATLISSTGNDVFSPVSRTEFVDLLGVLETNGLVSLNGSSASSTRANFMKATFKRSTSFTGANTKTSRETARWTEGTRLEEVLRGLGVDVANTDGSRGDSGDVMDEELLAIYARECSKMRRSTKANNAFSNSDVFDDAMED